MTAPVDVNMMKGELEKTPDSPLSSSVESSDDLRVESSHLLRALETITPSVTRDDILSYDEVFMFMWTCEYFMRL